jgi:hypothetical protein
MQSGLIIQSAEEFVAIVRNEIVTAWNKTANIEPRESRANDHSESLLASPLQCYPLVRLARLQINRNEGHRTRILRVAGCTTGTGHAGAIVNHQLVFHLGYST